MAVIGFPHGESWFVSGPAFRVVLDPVIAALPDGDDRDQVIQAREMQGLILDLMPADQATRIAAVLARTTSGLRAQLLHKPGADEWDLGLAERLETLGLLLDDFLGHGDSGDVERPRSADHEGR